MKLNKKIKTSVALLASAFLLASCAAGGGLPSEQKSPVDYVNPYMGNISHLLVPTYPTVHLTVCSVSIRSVPTLQVIC